MTWPTVKLGDIAKIDWGNTSITKASYVDKGYVAYSATGNDGFLPFAEHKRDGIVLSAIGARCGKCFIARGEWTAIKNTITIFPNTEQVCLEFLYVLLNDEKSWRIRGAGQPFITIGVAKEREIILPPLAEQQRIAAILDKAEDIKRKREQAIAKLEELAQSAFVEMFVNKAHFEQVVALKDICEFKYGKSLPAPQRKQGCIKVYGSNGVVGTHDMALTNGSTIVIGRKGSYGEINFCDTSCYPIDTTYYIDKSATNQNLVWLSYALARLGLNKMNKSAAVPGLSRDDAYRQTLHLPSIQKQNEFEIVVKKIVTDKSRYQKSLISISNLSKSLQHQAFTTGFDA